jgi:hypothetical protein
VTVLESPGARAPRTDETDERPEREGHAAATVDAPAGADVDARGVGPGAVVSVLFALVGWIVGSARLGDNSFLWHLRTGEYILDHGVPHRDVFSYTARGTTWVAQSWLAEVLYAGIDRTVGLFGIRVLTGLVGAAVAVLAYRLAARLSGSWLRGAGIAAVSVAGLFAMWSERPLVLGVLFLLVLLWVVEVPECRVGRHALVVVPVLLWLWVNVHGSFALGLAYLGLHVLGRWVDGAPPWVGRERTLVLGTAIGVVVSVVNPYGVALLTFPVQLLGRGEILSHVYEWQSPDFRDRWGIAFGVWLAVYAWALARGRHRVSRRDLVVTIPMVLLALWATRNIAIAPLVGMPVLARCFATEPRTGPRFSRAFVTTACAAIVLVGVVMGVAAASERSYAFETYPVKAMRFLEGHELLGQRIFTDDADAGFVINQYWPRQYVYMDDRYDMYPMPVMRDYLAVAAAGPDWEQILGRHDVETVVWRDDEALAGALDRSDGWVRIHHDRDFGVWVRADSPAASLAS